MERLALTLSAFLSSWIDFMMIIICMSIPFYERKQMEYVIIIETERLVDRSLNSKGKSYLKIDVRPNDTART